MKVRDILNLKVAVKRDIKSPVSHNVRLIDVLYHIPRSSESFFKRAQELPYKSEEQKTLKMRSPLYCPSMSCEIGKTVNQNSVVEYTSIISVDIDKCDNENVDLNQLSNLIFQLPYVIGVYKSFSGVGYYALILVKDIHKTKEYYSYLIKLFKSRFGITLDKQCSNITRLRTISWNDDPLTITKEFEEDITPFDLTLPSQSINPTVFRTKTCQNSIYKQKQYNSSDADVRARLNEVMWECANKGFYIDNLGSWYYLAGECKLCDRGYQLFEKFSSNNPDPSKKRDDHKIIRTTFDKSPTPQPKEIIGKWVNRLKQL